MKKEYITIQDASDLSKKSVQTIRRAIKAGKLRHRKRKTPQGFNYSINKESLSSLYNLRLEEEKQEKIVSKSEKAKTKKKVAPKKEVSQVSDSKSSDPMYITKEDFGSFTVTLEKLVSQHADERQNFLRLVNTLQEKIFVLENQLNLLKSPQKKWFNFWK